MAARNLKPVIWVRSSYDDLMAFPREARRHIGFALKAAQVGEKSMTPRRCADSAVRMSLRLLRILMAILTARFIRSDMPKQSTFFIVSRRNHDMGSLQIGAIST
jgi:hypothetical protein